MKIGMGEYFNKNGDVAYWRVVYLIVVNPAPRMVHYTGN